MKERGKRWAKFEGRKAEVENCGRAETIQPSAMHVYLEVSFIIFIVTYSQVSVNRISNKVGKQHKGIDIREKVQGNKGPEVVPHPSGN